MEPKLNGFGADSQVQYRDDAPTHPESVDWLSPSAEKSLDRLTFGKLVWSASEVDHLVSRVDAESPEESGPKVCGGDGVGLRVCT